MNNDAFMVAHDHHQAGRLDAALAAYDALEDPAPQAIANRADVLYQMGRHDEALQALDVLGIDSLESSLIRGNIYAYKKEWDESIRHFEKLVAVDRFKAIGLMSIGNAHKGAGRFRQSEHFLFDSLKLRNEDFPVWYNIGVLMQETRRFSEAISFYHEAMHRAPGDARIMWNLALCHLALEHWELGWGLYEWRWHTNGFVRRPSGTWREWQGEDLRHKTILVFTEQGHGDSLQMWRFVQQIEAREVIVYARPELHRLFLHNWVGGRRRNIRMLGYGAPLPEFDVWAPMMSLPRIMGMKKSSGRPYYRAHQTLVDSYGIALRDCLPAGVRPFRVGLVWAGEHRSDQPGCAEVDARRSMPLETLSPLASVPGVLFVSLQMGAKAGESGLARVSILPEGADWLDTAGVIANLDLVITVDTAVLHLAAGMGIPTWMLSRWDACWRWGPDASGSTHWYDNLRIFRQPVPGDWGSVVNAVRDELASILKRVRS